MALWSRSIGRRTRAVLGTAACIACVAAPVMAQDKAPATDDSTSTPAFTSTSASQGSDSTFVDFFKHTELSGFVDAYYGYNFNTPATGKAGFERAFDVQHNSFSLNLAEFALEKKPTADSRGGFRFDLDFGPTQTIVNAAEPGGAETYQHIGQAYLSYLAPAGNGVQIDFGKFVTPAGFEVIKTKDDWNYSRSILLAVAIPYYHMGVRATYAVNDKVSLAGYVVNGWNDAVDNNTGKSVALQAKVKPFGGLSITETYIGGPEHPNDNSDWRQLSDTVATFRATSKLSLAGDYDYGSDKEGGAPVKWQGIAGYARYQPTDCFALSPRLEYYNDRDGFTTGIAQHLKEFTLTAELKHKDGPVIRIEYRHDASDVASFLKNATEDSTSQNTFTFGLIYAFRTNAQ